MEKVSYIKLKEAAKILRVKEEQLPNTLKRFKREIEEMKKVLEE